MYLLPGFKWECRFFTIVAAIRSHFLFRECGVISSSLIWRGSILRILFLRFNRHDCLLSFVVSFRLGSQYGSHGSPRFSLADQTRLVFRPRSCFGSLSRIRLSLVCFPLLLESVLCISTRSSVGCSEFCLLSLSTFPVTLTISLWAVLF